MNKRRAHKQEEARRRRAYQILAAVTLFVLLSVAVDLATKGRHRQDLDAASPGPTASTPQQPTALSRPDPSGNSQPARLASPRLQPPLWQVEPETGDLDRMVAARRIRVLVPFSKTFYFLDKANRWA